ncbi:unnamed protein product [Nesidiocoris tenuis]|uniref:Uncharacterized protein n=1 Tax=Nesidiocoris tenuis TaxID=355587 RepID=A0A6H5GHH6_9HEMI|nr:unnamed protein product [Nesidiocoris tenuis]
MSQGSKIDRIYRKLLLTKYFTQGWGSSRDIKRLLAFRKIVSDRAKCVNLIPEHYPVEIVKDQVNRGVRMIEGRFHCPFDLYLPELLPKVVKTCHFQMLLPVKWESDHYKPVCIQMAGTGDHYYWRRRVLMAKPLLTEYRIGSIIIENPFYGVRKPPQQTRSILNNVLDIFTMGGCLIMEGMILHSWCKKIGLGPIGFTGYSMGGHMATLAATSIPEPVVLVPCLSWSTASGVFTEGVMSKAINWNLLHTQYNEDESFKRELKDTVRSLSEVCMTQSFERNSVQESKGTRYDKNIICLLCYYIIMGGKLAASCFKCCRV